VAQRPSHRLYRGLRGGSKKRIAYSGLTRTDWEVFIIDARGGGRFNVTKNDTYDYYPDYSPNGKKIAYVAKDTKAR
jgi:Tol biopolymer transport system component